MHDTHMPCHCVVDYEDPNWKDQLETAAHCAGSLVFLRNTCKQPRDLELSIMTTLVKPSNEIFQWSVEFLDHHRR